MLNVIVARVAIPTYYQAALTAALRSPARHQAHGHLQSRTARLYHGANGEHHQQLPAGMRVVDLRSDTVTRPTAAMRRAMAEAEVGDDVMGDDPTVQALERKVADMLGFESALYVPSGTMANLISIMCHCTARDSEIIVGDKCHIHLYEQGGCATVAGVHPRVMPNRPDGTIDPDLLRAKVRSEDVHYPVTKLICLENTHNYCGGKVLPLDYLDQVVALAKEVGVPLHMDGARLPNAAAALGVPMSRILRGFASSTLCLSKSLSAPVGSLIVGSAQFIKQARRTRKVLGGGMRQVGVLAAAGLLAVDVMCDRLVDDHQRARRLAEAINSCGKPGASVDLENLHSNILLLDLDPNVMLPDQFCQRMQEAPPEEIQALGEPVAVHMFPMSSSNVRMVLHADVSDADVTKVAQKLVFVIRGLSGSRQTPTGTRLQRGVSVIVE
ncbi:probable low-specificity L-threonine aldolase 2 isoform X2 [Pollicipes pollicipes]|uniref:probable low-specificity L-threonine aldolase 2 isoform X2 n=2 Tax=Pollicipes pollicipes TaxID=41117 RepID=UPI0018854BBC|nr:probable low-specificity L-threonine aldolase 2 isoform X2 [Pollicipes pollicipes]